MPIAIINSAREKARRLPPAVVNMVGVNIDVSTSFLAEKLGGVNVNR
jgi:hypothetical protein